MSLSQGRINDRTLASFLSCLWGDENVAAIQKQLGIGSYALTDGSSHGEPHSLLSVGNETPDLPNVNRLDVSGVLCFSRPRIVNGFLVKAVFAPKGDEIVLAIFFPAIAKSYREEWS